MKDDRDIKQEKINRIIQCYELDLEERDLETEDLQSKIIELSEQQIVLRAEIEEALDQRDEVLKRAFLLSKQMENMKMEIEETEQENLELKRTFDKIQDSDVFQVKWVYE